MLDGCLGRRHVVHGDVVGGAAEDALAEDDQRKRDVQQLGIRFADVNRAEHDAVGQAKAATGDDIEFVLTHTVGLVDDHHEASLLRRHDDRVGQFSEIRLPYGGDRKADDTRLSRPKAASGEIGLVTELLDRHEHPVAGGRPHVRVVIDDVGDGLDRHARDASDIVQRGIHVASLTGARSAFACAASLALPFWAVAGWERSRRVTPDHADRGTEMLAGTMTA